MEPKAVCGGTQYGNTCFFFIRYHGDLMRVPCVIVAEFSIFRGVCGWVVWVGRVCLCVI